MLIDDFSKTNLTSCLGPTWIGVSDQVMGGNSEARIEKTIVKFRRCLRLTGNVRLENNGGFIQAALSLSTRDTVLDASMFSRDQLLHTEMMRSTLCICAQRIIPVRGNHIAVTS